MGFSAVIFDLGGVVLGSPLRAFLEYEREVGLAPGTLGGAVLGGGEQGAWARLERGELDAAAFCPAFDAELSALGARISSEELLRRIGAASQPRARMLAAIRRLRAQGLRTAALTNNWVSPDMDTKMALVRVEFDVFVESALVGLRKPDPRIYLLTCERLQVAPERAVFLDDIGANLKAARALGMATIKVVDPEAALGELEDVLGFRLLAPDARVEEQA